MKLRQPLGFVLAALSLVCIFAGCNDTFRPVVNPIPQPGGVPSQMKIILVLSSTGNTSSSPGVLSLIDVSGDTNIGEIQLGHNVSTVALGTGNNIVYVANQADSTISTINGIVPNSTTPLTLTQSVSALPANVLCPTAPCLPLNPMVVGGNNLYVAQAAPQSGPTGQGSVLATSAVTGLNVLAQISVGKAGNNSFPSQLLSSASAGKVYSLNTNTNDLTSWSFQSNLVASPSIQVGTNPISAVINAQGSRLFTLNAGDGTVSVINTANDTVVNTGNPYVMPSPSPSPVPTATPILVGLNPTAMFLDNNNNRLFVANNGDNTISVANVAVPLPTASPSPTANPNPNFGQTTTISLPNSCIPPVPIAAPSPKPAPTSFPVKALNVVATPDGNRAYVLSGDSSGHACVFLVSLLDNRVVPTPVLTASTYPAGPLTYAFVISSDGAKVYLVAEAPPGIPGQQTPVTFGDTLGNVYAANAASVSTNGTITVVNSTITSSNNTVAAINVPEQPVGAPPVPNATPSPTPAFPASPVQVLAQP